MSFPTKLIAGACALAAIVPSAALAAAPQSGPGVPRGQIEVSRYTVQVSGSNAVARHESTRQWLTATNSHTIARTIPNGKLRFEGATSRKREYRFDAATNKLFIGPGSKKPPYQSQAQEARVFAQSVAQGCYTLTGDTMFRGHSAQLYKLVPATSGPCRGDASIGETIVDKADGTILQRTAGTADGSFTEVDTLISLKTVRLNHATAKLLRMGAHPHAHIERHER